MRRLGLGLAFLALGCGGPEERPTAPTATVEDSAATLPDDDGPPVRGDWLVQHALADPENLNPLTSNDSGASQINSLIFSPLVTIHPETLEFVPVLAAKLPEVAPDHLTYTYELRPDASFSDGKPVRAEDVVFFLKATLNPKVNAPHQRNYYDSVKDAEALSPTVVRITLSQVYFLNDFTLGGITPLPRHYYDPENLLEGISVAELRGFDALAPEKKLRAESFARAFNADFNRRPMGPGALVLEKPERDWQTGARIELRRRENFWAADQPLLGDPYVNRMVWRVINNQTAALASLKAGEIDELGLSPIQHGKETGDERFAARFEKHVELGGGYQYIGWNLQRPIFADPRVRRALSHLVDKRNIVDKIALGLGEPIEGPISPKRPEYNEKLAPWPFDPQKAKALLAEAGFSDSDGDGVLDAELEGKRVPLRFEIVTNSGNDVRGAIGLVVRDEFKAAGIDASFRAVDWSILLDKVKHFDFDAVILGWSSSAAMPPDAYQIWHSSQAVENGSNAVAFKNAEVDRILEDYRIEFDPAKRKRLYDRLQEILYEQQPYTFLYAAKGVTAWDRRFKGVRWYRSGGSMQTEWFVPVAQQKYR